MDNKLYGHCTVSVTINETEITNISVTCSTERKRAGAGARLCLMMYDIITKWAATL